MSYIYKITNTANGMAYVGNTSCSINERWKQHVKDSRSKRCSKRPLYSAMNEYGYKNFAIELIEECDNEFAPEREKFWISKYDTYANGYNDTMGGTGKSRIDHKLLIATYRKTRSQKKTAQLLNICEDSVRKILNAENIKRYSKEDTYRDYINPANAYNEKGECVEKFASVSAAARWLHEQGRCKSWASAEVNIRKSIKKPNGSPFGGYVWKKPTV